MAWQIPWIISGVTEVPLDVARVMSYAATGGQEGVIGPTDLQVKSLATPGSSVTVDTGAFVALNRYAPGTTQSYIGYNVGQTTVAVPAAGVGGRVDLLAAIVVDPGQTGGGATAGPVETRIIQNVGANVTALNQVAGYANVAGYALARIATPASGGAITQAMITDLRALSQPRRSRVVQILNMGPGSDENTVGASWGLFPNLATWSIDIPTWATRMAVIGHVAGLEVRGTTGNGWVGKMRAKAGASKYTQETDVNVTVASGAKSTVSSLIAGDMAVAPSERGTVGTFRFEAVKNSGQGTLYAQHGTVMVLEVTFYTATEVV